ncbi:MAG TPA: hypothetical protein GX516_07650, partial [Thermoanaerobacter sp.]|nr:hypothetical protein [Thermoanaerobacter sp.]
RDGSFVLMEINPKFWASYPLASKYGYRFASLMVSSILDIPRTRVLVRKKGMMVFPIRELSYELNNKNNESLVKSILSMLWPPSKMDINVRDLKAWIHCASLRSKIKNG